MLWSTVICFKTASVKVYLKLIMKYFDREPILLDFLHQQKVCNLPTIVVINNNDHSAFLMRDDREILLSILKKISMDLIKLSIQSYAKFQIDCILCANGLIDKGIMDYHSVNNLPFLYTEFLNNSRESFLAFELTLQEIEQLRNLDKVFAEKSKTFASFNIAETLEHGDFHDNNIFTFFFICSFLYSVKHNYNLNNTDNNYKIMQDTYINEWYSYGHYNR